MGWTLTDEHIRLAQETERKYGVPASVTLGQFITESGAGTSDLFQISNNGFGIIGSYNGQKVWYYDRYWRKYSSLEESFDDHGRLLSSGQYAEATKGATTVDEYISAILPIYAPASDGNSGYPALLRAVIRDNNLTQYDLGTLGSSSNLSGSGSVSSGSSSGATVSGSSGGSLRDALMAMLSALIKGVAVVVVVALGFVFFAQAFDDKLVKNTVKEVAGND